MKMFTVYSAIALLGLIILSGCAQKENTDKVIKIGAVLPISGEGTVDQGQASQKAIMLAAD